MSTEITLRLFAAAAEAAGVEALRLPLEDETSLATLRDELPRLLAEHGERAGAAAPSSSDAPALETVLPRCSFLVDGVRARLDGSEAAGASVLRGGETVDVLPPFAGG